MLPRDGDLLLRADGGDSDLVLLPDGGLVFLPLLLASSSSSSLIRDL